MERKIGEIFELGGVKLQVVEDSEYTSHCKGCYFEYNCSNFMSQFVLHIQGKMESL